MTTTPELTPDEAAYETEEAERAQAWHVDYCRDNGDCGHTPWLDDLPNTPRKTRPLNNTNREGR